MNHSKAAVAWTVMQEICFWKRQEKEHARFMRMWLTSLEMRHDKVLQEWETLFARTEAAGREWLQRRHRAEESSGPAPNQPGARPEAFSPQQEAQFGQLVEAALQQSADWTMQLARLVKQTAAAGPDSTGNAVMLDHFIRESRYFIAMVRSTQLYGEGSALAESASPSAEAPPSLAPVPAVGGAAARQGRGLRDGDALPVSPLTGDSTWSEPAGAGKPVPIGKHTLPPLPYAYNALEPHIDEATMRIHHTKHHQSYVDGLNKAERMMAKARDSGDYELIRHWEREAAFHGAGHYLHTVFWPAMSPKGGGKPSGALAAQIEKDFGGFQKFKEHFTAAAENVEGPGWAILVWSPRSHRLEILAAEKHQLMSQWDVIPLLPLDVWEHAHYLKYQNDRKAYIEAWWNLVNWPYIQGRFQTARQVKWTPY